MTITTISIREFDQDVAHAKRAAASGPVLVTDDGKPAFALLSIEDYDRLTAAPRERTFLEFMDSIPGGDFEFEPPRLELKLQVPDFE